VRWSPQKILAILPDTACVPSAVRGRVLIGQLLPAADHRSG